MIHLCIITFMAKYNLESRKNAMINYTGPNWEIMNHEYKTTMEVVSGYYADILMEKFQKIDGEDRKEEKMLFIQNIQDFVQRDYSLSDSLRMSITGKVGSCSDILSKGKVRTLVI